MAASMTTSASCGRHESRWAWRHCTSGFSAACGLRCLVPPSQIESYGLESLRPNMEKYYQEMKRLAQTLWMLVGKAMGVDEVSGFQEPPSESVMRLLRYPAANARGVEGYSASQLRMAPHTDIGPITILPADPSESLEYWTSKGELACTHGHHLGVNGEGTCLLRCRLAAHRIQSQHVPGSSW